MRLVELRPEQRDQSVAALKAAVGREDQKRQERNGLGLCEQLVGDTRRGAPKLDASEQAEFKILRDCVSRHWIWHR